MNKLTRKILCFLGFHEIEEYWGMYKLGTCIHCGASDMYF
jgi:hypothetical protein